MEVRFDKDGRNGLENMENSGFLEGVNGIRGLDGLVAESHESVVVMEGESEVGTWTDDWRWAFFAPVIKYAEINHVEGHELNDRMVKDCRGGIFGYPSWTAALHSGVGPAGKDARRQDYNCSASSYKS